MSGKTVSNISPTLAVLFHRLGPYHFARLRAAGRLLPIVAIESSGVDETYAWDVVEGADCFERITLFDHADAQKLPAAEVVSRVGLALDKVHPAVVVVPGWADSAALGALHWCVQNQVPAVAMSESTVWDKTRSVWREAVKRQIVGCFAAALVGGTPHKDYMVKLGMPAEHVFLGYDAVDNEYFAAGAAKWQKQPGEVANQRLLGPRPGDAGGPLEYGIDSTGQVPVKHAEDFTGQGRLHGPRKSEVGRKFGLPENYFLASARFVEKKNLLRLIEAYARYRQLAAAADNGLQDNKTTGPSVVSSQSSVVGGRPSAPWSLVLLGDGPLRENLNSQLLARDLSESTLNLHDHVQMPGFKQYPDLPAYYGLANAFIHASTTEQWGLVVNEAMASGLPVLVSNRCGCATDLVQDGVNGFTFDPYNIEEMAQLILKLSTLNPSQLSTMCAASQRIISNLGPERFAQGLKAAVEKALEVGPKQAGFVDRLVLRALLAR